MGQTAHVHVHHLRLNLIAKCIKLAVLKTIEHVNCMFKFRIVEVAKLAHQFIAPASLASLLTLSPPKCMVINLTICDYVFNHTLSFLQFTSIGYTNKISWYIRKGKK